MRRSLEVERVHSPNIRLRLSEIIFFCGASINSIESRDGAHGTVHRFDISLPSREDLDTVKGKLWEAGFPAREV